jgi:hypothetical protein
VINFVREVLRIGLLGAGPFGTDPVRGYPPGMPAVPIETTASGALHDLFLCQPSSSLPPNVSSSPEVQAGAGQEAAFLGAFFLSGVGFQQTEPFVDVGRLWQRVCALIGWTWLTVFAMRLLREAKSSI